MEDIVNNNWPEGESPHEKRDNTSNPDIQLHVDRSQRERAPQQLVNREERERQEVDDTQHATQTCCQAAESIPKQPSV